MNTLKDLYFKIIDAVEPLNTPEAKEAERKAHRLIKGREAEEAAYGYALVGHAEGWLDGFQYAVNLLRECDRKGGAYNG